MFENEVFPSLKLYSICDRKVSAGCRQVTSPNSHLKAVISPQKILAIKFEEKISKDVWKVLPVSSVLLYGNQF